jgi:hypothetical protein
MRKPVSRAQARYFGLICAGKVHKKGISKTKACNADRGIKYAPLPERVSAPTARTLK